VRTRIDAQRNSYAQVDEVSALLNDCAARRGEGQCGRGERDAERRGRTRAAVLALHPPGRLGDVGVRAVVAGVGRHDLELVLLDDLAHLLDDCAREKDKSQRASSSPGSVHDEEKQGRTAQVAKEVADRDDGLGLDERVGDLERVLDRVRRERLLDEHLQAIK